MTAPVVGSWLIVTTGFSVTVARGCPAAGAQGFACPGTIRQVATTVAWTPNEVLTTAASAGAAAVKQATSTTAHSRHLEFSTFALPCFILL